MAVSDHGNIVHRPRKRTADAGRQDVQPPIKRTKEDASAPATNDPFAAEKDKLLKTKQKLERKLERKLKRDLKRQADEAPPAHSPEGLPEADSVVSRTGHFSGSIIDLAPVAEDEPVTEDAPVTEEAPVTQDETSEGKKERRRKKHEEKEKLRKK